MSQPNKVILIIGYGPNIGQHTAKRFSAIGYAVAARSLVQGQTEDGYLAEPVDLTEPKNLEGLFKTVEEKLGAPNVVVYNGRSSEVRIVQSSRN
jgi:NAD(P)-dependent dehydrogenase (short-subunit alcohol dehydrogenase family)